MEVTVIKKKKRNIIKQLTTGILLLGLTMTSLLLLAPSLVKAFSYSFLRELVKTHFLFQTRHLSEIEGKNFIVRYYPTDESIARIVLENAESIYEPVGDKLQFTPKSKIPVVIYPTRESLSKSFGWEANESAMGVYWAGVIRILSPQEWIYSNDEEEIKEVFAANGPMAHELSHLVIDYYTRGNYTRWFTEGIAQHIEYQLTGFMLDEDGTSLKEPLYPFDMMDSDFDNLKDQSLAYRQSMVAVEYIIESYGQDNLLLILEELRKGYSLDKSMQNALGITMKQFESEFKAWVKIKMK